MAYQVFKTETVIETMNGKEFEVLVSYSWDLDDCPPDFDYGSQEANDAEMKRFESGELVCMLLKVTASALGEIGSDYLGQTFVRSRQAEYDLFETATTHQMREAAILELRANMVHAFEALKKVLA